MPGADDLTVLDDHCPDRHVIVLQRALGFAQREPHEVLIAREEVIAHQARVCLTGAPGDPEL
jgi:hypothetical protein